MSAFDRLGADTSSSASTLFSSAEHLLRHARSEGEGALRRAALEVCRAQPSMGALWNLAAAALTSEALFERLAARAARSTAAAARVASDLLAGDTRRIVTCSRSAIVEAVIRKLRVPAVCAEARPALEGRTLAADLARDGVLVTSVSDAAIGSDLRAGDVVLVGADAVAAEWFVNKTGTGQLCAAATLTGVPAYVVAGLEKCVRREIADALRLRADDPRTLWADAPAGVIVQNVLFERVPQDRVAGVISDAGVLAGDTIAQACEASIPAAAARALLEAW